MFKTYHEYFLFFCPISSSGNMFHFWHAILNYQATSITLPPLRKKTLSLESDQTTKPDGSSLGPWEPTRIFQDLGSDRCRSQSRPPSHRPRRCPKEASRAPRFVPWAWRPRSWRRGRSGGNGTGGRSVAPGWWRSWAEMEGFLIGLPRVIIHL